MEFEVKNLINKIKKDGIEEAKQEASKILNEANLKKQEIINSALSQAKEELKSAKREAEEFKVNSLNATKQAVRDIIIGVETSLKQLFLTSLNLEVEKTMKPQFISSLITSVLKNWIEEGDLEILVNESDREELASLLKSSLGPILEKGVEIKPFKDSSKGFKIKRKGSNLYYDFSTQTISEFLFEYLNPRFKNVVKE